MSGFAEPGSTQHWVSTGESQIVASPQQNQCLYLRVLTAVLSYSRYRMFPWKLGLIDHDAPPADRKITSVIFLINDLSLVSHLSLINDLSLLSHLSLFSHLFLLSVTCLASWCWLSPISPVSGAAECHHHRQNPNPELWPDRCRSPEEELPADTVNTRFFLVHNLTD